jgi:hypothetical protein
MSTPELILPDRFMVIVTPTEYQVSEQKFYAGNISRLALTTIPKAAVVTIVIKPVIFSYYLTLKAFFEDVRQHKNFKVNRTKLTSKNRAIPYLLATERLFFFKEPVKLEEKNIGHNGVLEKLTIVLEESYQLVPVAPTIIPSPGSVRSAKKIMYVKTYIR